MDGQYLFFVLRVWSGKHTDFVSSFFSGGCYATAKCRCGQLDKEAPSRLCGFRMKWLFICF